MNNGKFTVWMTRVGPLRVLGAAIVAMCVALAPLSGLPGRGWALIPSAVAPGIAVFLIWALPFDMLMARLFSRDQGEVGAQRFRAVLWLDLVALAALIIAWGPFFVRLLRPPSM